MFGLANAILGTNSVAGAKLEFGDFLKKKTIKIERHYVNFRISEKNPPTLAIFNAIFIFIIMRSL